jgi:hypothetical protein
MGHPQIIGSRQLMQYDEGNPLKSQDNHAGLRALPRNSVECGIFQFATLSSLVAILLP